MKNNLQIISSSASLQMSGNPAAEALKAIQGRVKSMSLIHEGLCFSGILAEVDFGRYVSRLGHQVIHSWSASADAIALHVDADIILQLDEAPPCALIVNELLSNALKHAFPGSRHGDIWVTAREGGGEVSLQVRDNGTGLAEGFSPWDGDSLGLIIVGDLCAQLHGAFSWANDGGAVFSVRFQRGASGSQSQDVRRPATLEVSTS